MFDDNSNTIGDIGSRNKVETIKRLLMVASIIVYLGFLVYSGVHNYSLMKKGIDPSYLIWAVVGVVAIEISAGALPAAIHFWTHDSMQRTIAFAFYGLDIALIVCNIILDNSIQADTVRPAWMETYLFFAVPITPVFAALGWSFIWLLDPSQKILAVQERVRADAAVALEMKVLQAAKQVDVNQVVGRAAANLVEQQVKSQLAGFLSVQQAQPGIRQLQAPLSGAVNAPIASRHPEMMTNNVEASSLPKESELPDPKGNHRGTGKGA